MVLATIVIGVATYSYWSLVGNGANVVYFVSLVYSAWAILLGVVMLIQPHKRKTHLIEALYAIGVMSIVVFAANSILKYLFPYAVAVVDDFPNVLIRIIISAAVGLYASRIMAILTLTAILIALPESKR